MSQRSVGPCVSCGGATELVFTDYHCKVDCHLRAAAPTQQGQPLSSFEAHLPPGTALEVVGAAPDQKWRIGYWLLVSRFAIPARLAVVTPKMRQLRDTYAVLKTPYKDFVAWGWGDKFGYTFTAVSEIPDWLKAF